MRRARKKHFQQHVYHQRAMQVGPKKTKRTLRPRSLTRRSNELTQMHCKSVPSRALAQSQMSTTVSSRTVDMTPSPCRRLVTTRASTSTLPIPLRPSPKWRRKSALLLRSTRCPVFWRFRPLQGMESQCLQDRA